MNLKELIKELGNGNSQGLTLDGYLEDFINNQLLQSETMQKALGLSDQELEDLYRQGYELYMQDRFEEAVTYFHWLAILNPFIPKFWMGLGASRQFLKDYENALKAYALVIMLDPIDPYPHFHAYECYEAMGETREGIKALYLAEQRSQAHSAYRSLLQKIKQHLLKINK